MFDLATIKTMNSRKGVKQIQKLAKLTNKARQVDKPAKKG